MVSQRGGARTDDPREYGCQRCGNTHFCGSLDRLNFLLMAKSTCADIHRHFYRSDGRITRDLDLENVKQQQHSDLQEARQTLRIHPVGCFRYLYPWLR